MNNNFSIKELEHMLHSATSEDTNMAIAMLDALTNVGTLENYQYYIMRLKAACALMYKLE